jgi:pimeloyl-ACP methyl ester carboxylesterase
MPSPPHPHQPAICRTLAVLVLIAAWTEPGAALQDPDSPGFTSIETTYRSGDLTIAATLLLPDGDGPFPAAVLIQGAGPSSRTNLWSRMIAQELTLRGIAAYLPDKRGTGDTGGDLLSADFADLARDIAAAVDYLVTRPEIDGEAVGVIGLSQGGFYAPAVAVANDRVRFAGAVSASVLPFAETVDHEMTNTFLQDGLNADEYDAAMALQRAVWEYAAGGPWSAYDQQRAAALVVAPESDAILGFPSTEDDRLWGWLALVREYDPMIYWRQVDTPLFFAFGELDEDDNVPVRRSVLRIQEGLDGAAVTVRVYPESGHALYDPTLLEQGEAEIRDDFGAHLADWILRVVAAQP